MDFVKARFAHTQTWKMPGKTKVKKTQTKTLVRTRDFVTKNIKSLFGNAEKIYDDYKQSKLCLLISHKQLLQQKLEKYSELFESIGKPIKDDTQFGYEFELFSQNEKDFNHKLVVLVEFIKKQEHPVENTSTKIVGTRGQLKLPKFEIKKFDGKNPIEWTSFYDLFNEAISKNSSLSNV